jgi:hypothetical protein
MRPGTLREPSQLLFFETFDSSKRKRRSRGSALL